MSSQCTALNVSDVKRCEAPATSTNGLFCIYHSKQCQGLYSGYKKRNAQLDRVTTSPPSYLAKHHIALANQTFSDLNDEETLKDVHSHLFLRYNLLDRVIRARKLHHSRFFSLNLDYGHQHYLDQLQSQKTIVLRALERLDRRSTEVIYGKRKWYDWIRDQQDDEEAQRENEKKKLKREAALFQRHSKEISARLHHMRGKENKKRQEEYLDKAYRDRISEQELEELNEDQWDPIDDVIEDERFNYIELIKRFLWIESEDLPYANGVDKSEIDSIAISKKNASSNGASGQTTNESKIKRTKKKPETEAPARTPDKGFIETRNDMQRRLAQGEEYQSRPDGYYMVGTLGQPHELMKKSAGLPGDEIDVLLQDITEIKHLLFCRLILSHANLLPIALQCENVHDFLNHGCVNHAELRDLCLKMEQPALQAIRDACADLVRGAEEGDDEDEEPVKDLEDVGATNRQKAPKQGEEHKRMNENRNAPRFLNPETEENAGAFVNFPKVDDRSQFYIKKERIKVCGRYIYNYPSEKAMTRGGWLQYSIIAKGSNLFDAMYLCRSWDEFFELNILALFHYFPASNWLEWVGDQFRQQMLQLGFIVYYQFDEAFKLTRHQQTGSRSQFRKAHQFVEFRNFMCAHIKRNDPVSRRLIQYLSMESHELLVLVRDAKTDEILVTPRRDQMWIGRAKRGVGRASKNDWEILREVGPTFFDEMQDLRAWRFGFKEYYDVYIWDLEPGQGFGGLYNKVQASIMKAQRCRSAEDRYNTAGPILKTLTRDRDTGRARDIKSGENVMSIWDDFRHENSKMVFYSVNPKTREIVEEEEGAGEEYHYNHGDFLEDQILFPEDAEGHEESASAMSAIGDAMARLEISRTANPRFMLDLDVDEPLPLLAESTEGSDEQDSNSSHHEIDAETTSLILSRRGDGNKLWAKLHDKRLPSKAHHDLEEFHRFVNEGVKPETLDFFPTIFEQKEAADTLEGWALGYPDPQEPREALVQYTDREKAFLFKRSWHAADLEPNAQEHYLEANEMIEAADRFSNQACKDKMHLCAQILLWLKYDPASHLRVLEDVYRAHAMIVLFFPKLSSPFFSSEMGSKFKDSRLVRQNDRATQIPKVRSYTSNKYRNDKFWAEWSKIYKDNVYHQGDFPEEWNYVIRPKIAKLYREGVIESCPQPGTSGQAIAARDDPHHHDSQLDLFFDYRLGMEDTSFPVALTNPYKLPPLLASAKRYASTHSGGARFALLRLWSASHFYPLMLGLDSREGLAFTDGLGRSWQWKFIPKDMPYSELSMHRQLELRLEPYVDPGNRAGEEGGRGGGVLAGNVVFKRNAILVMGADERELLRYAAATVFVLQTRPWKMEVDLWKSFVNVDLEFLQRLDGYWLE